MDLTTLLAMFSFSLAMSITPGPVNMMIISSGVNHGFKTTVPFISGATIGFTLLLILIGFGLMNIVNHYPSLLSTMEILGALFIIYMGYKIATSRADITVKNQEKKVPKFYEGFLLQWLNPKAWIACVSGVSMFVSSDTAFLSFVLIYFSVCYASLSFWGVLGQKATMFFNTPIRLKFFNITMGAILIISAGLLIVMKMM
ncbi:LysE family translocator [Sulfurospirillum arcachonense]|uniref:LysE family translocator n=1 Tax=Sulfurospirillum arcachonense TaxID=57666 RepID=UPI000468039D|nr:LysE family translocator [Sulfurospirillum arcachonense]